MSVYTPSLAGRALSLHRYNLCLWGFAAIVGAHWSEHIVQAFQVYALDWARPESRGILGQFFPVLVSSEWLHYGYAIVMLVGLWLLRTGFEDRALQFWMLSFWIQFWHHIEHLSLVIQAQTGMNLGGESAPTSFVQFFIPRIELHLFYNSIVTVPMVVAMVLRHRAIKDAQTAADPAST